MRKEPPQGGIFQPSSRVGRKVCEGGCILSQAMEEGPFFSSPVECIETKEKVHTPVHGVAALLRRTDRETVEPRLSIYRAPGIRVNFDTHEVSIGDKVVRLALGESRSIEADPALPSLIITHRGLGYSFSPEGD